MVRAHLIEAGLVALLLTASPSTLRAQASACTYDRCALALHRGFWGRYLVRGDSAVRVARIGFRAPTLAEFAERQDSVGVYIRQFRAGHTSGNWFLVLGTLTAAVGQILVQESRQDAVGTGVLAIGLGVLIVGAERRRHSDNALQRAIWFYNGTLTR